MKNVGEKKVLALTKLNRIDIKLAKIATPELEHSANLVAQEKQNEM